MDSEVGFEREEEDDFFPLFSILGAAKDVAVWGECNELLRDWVTRGVRCGLHVCMATTDRTQFLIDVDAY
jgi:hypothetical protein